MLSKNRKLCHDLKITYGVKGYIFPKHFHMNIIRVLNCSDPDEDRCSVSPDMGSNCFAKVTAHHKNRCWQVEIKMNK